MVVAVGDVCFLEESTERSHAQQQQQKGRTELFFKADVFLFLPSGPGGAITA